MTEISWTNKLEGWVPIRFYRREGEPTLDWCYLGSALFNEPFFAQTVETSLRRPFNLLFRHQTPIEAVEELRHTSPGVDPSGFIFHISRCGSTLVSQMLAAVPEHIVISEAALIDSVITRRKANAVATNEQRILWLKGIINALGQKRTGREHRLFVKFDAWNIMDLPLIRQAYPDVPWIFLYRDPVEVLVSQLGHRGAHMVPGVIDPQLFGLDSEKITTVPPEEYCALVLASLCKAGLEHYPNGGMLVNYSELPAAVFSAGGLFGADWAEYELNLMRGAARLDAKNPYQNFEDDRERKKRLATVAVVEAANKWLYPIYEELEAARTRQSGLRFGQ